MRRIPRKFVAGLLALFLVQGLSAGYAKASTRCAPTLGIDKGEDRWTWNVRAGTVRHSASGQRRAPADRLGWQLAPAVVTVKGETLLVPIDDIRRLAGLADEVENSSVQVLLAAISGDGAIFTVMRLPFTTTGFDSPVPTEAAIVQLDARGELLLLSGTETGLRAVGVLGAGASRTVVAVGPVAGGLTRLVSISLSDRTVKPLVESADQIEPLAVSEGAAMFGIRAPASSSSMRVVEVAPDQPAHTVAEFAGGWRYKPRIGYSPAVAASYGRIGSIVVGPLIDDKIRALLRIARQKDRAVSLPTGIDGADAPLVLATRDGFVVSGGTQTAFVWTSRTLKTINNRWLAPIDRVLVLAEC